MEGLNAPTKAALGNRPMTPRSDLESKIITTKNASRLYVLPRFCRLNTAS